MKRIILIVGLIASSLAYASDHIDGPITSKHGVGDISDLYVFPSPGKKESLSIILNSNPFVSHKGHFEERLRYVIRIREASISNGAIGITPEENTITCKFLRPHKKDNVAICEGNNGLRVEGKINQVNQGNGFRMWSGMRTDPFFFNDKWALSASKKGMLLTPQSENTMDKLNILSIVLEIETDKLFVAKPEGSKGSLYVVMSEIWVQNSSTSAPELLDSVGRPEITNVSLVAHQGDAEIRDQYNILESPFVSRIDKKKFIDRLVKNISFYDQLDRSNDWQETDKVAVANLFAADYLIVDISKPCVDHNFLSIERALLAKSEHNNCGGRRLENDIMDELFSFYINKGRTILRDGVDKPYRPISNVFPYLAEPDTSLLARIKATLARQTAL